MQTCLIKLNSTEIRKIHGFKNKSGIAVYGNKLEYIKVFCWVCGFGQKISLFSFVFLIFFLQCWLKTREDPMRLSVEWERQLRSESSGILGTPASLMHDMGSSKTLLLTVPGDIAFFALSRLHFSHGDSKRGFFVPEACRKASAFRLDRKCSL